MWPRLHFFRRLVTRDTQRTGLNAFDRSLDAAQRNRGHPRTKFLMASVKRCVGASWSSEIAQSSTAQFLDSAALHRGYACYLKESVRKAGLDPDNLPSADKTAMNFGQGAVKAWKDIWGSGRGVGQMDDVPATAVLVERLRTEYREAVAAQQAKSAAYI